MGVWDRLLRRAQTRVWRSAKEPKQTAPSQQRRVNPLQIAQGTDLGRVREHNEDAFFTLKALLGPETSLSPLGLLLVADGLGGHAQGSEASSTAVRVAGEILVREILLPLLHDQDQEDRRRPIQEILTEATRAANRSVARMGTNAGTTLTSVLILDHSAYIANVGDTRVYYLSDNKANQLTEDHSLVRRLVDLGEISPQEAQSHPQRNLLYRALGEDSEVEVDTYFQRLAEGSSLVVCSDGLWNMVSEDEMLEVLGDTLTLQEACNQLIDRANNAGGDDNITAVLARINY